MAKRSFDKKPLYRRENRTTHGAHKGYGGEYRWRRNTKSEKASEVTRQGMGPKHQHGHDYTPLFKFLLSKVGEDWDDVHAQAVGRLDKEDPIFWMVARTEEERQSIVRIGEATYYSGLYIDAGNRLAIVAPEIGPDNFLPTCGCCTHSLNGMPVSTPYDPEFRYQNVWTSS